MCGWRGEYSWAESHKRAPTLIIRWPPFLATCLPCTGNTAGDKRKRNIKQDFREYKENNMSPMRALENNGRVRKAKHSSGKDLEYKSNLAKIAINEHQRHNRSHSTCKTKEDRREYGDRSLWKTQKIRHWKINTISQKRQQNTSTVTEKKM